MHKKIFFIISICILAGSLAACKNNELSQEEQIIVAQNDWAGSFSRLAKIQQDVMNSVSILDTHNYKIIEGNPLDYWDNEDYNYLNFVPVYSDILACTAYFNEIDDFSVIQEMMTTQLTNIGYNVSSVSKIDTNHYAINVNCHGASWRNLDNVYKEKHIDCIYDASHDWLQLSTSVTEDFGVISSEEELYEFARLDDGIYAFQNESERLYVVYENGVLKEYYYSCLPDVTYQRIEEYEKLLEERSEQEEYELSVKEDMNEAETVMNEEELILTDTENIGLHYTKADNSIFMNLENINPEWVNAPKDKKMYITYCNHVLAVNRLNELTGVIESFTIKEAPVPNEVTQDVLIK